MPPRNCGRDDPSSSAIDVLGGAAPPSQPVVELASRTHKRLDEFLRSRAFNDLGLCQPVSQSLALRISHDGSRLEQKGDDICSRKEKEKVPRGSLTIRQ
jgi:hypothetical protein